MSMPTSASWARDPWAEPVRCRLASGGRGDDRDRLRVALPPMEHPAFDGRAYAVALGSRALLDAAGLWDALPDPPNPILDIRVTDGRVGRRASRLQLHFGHQEAGDTPFGWMVEARGLRRALNARCACAGTRRACTLPPRRSSNATRVARW